MHQYSNKTRTKLIYLDIPNNLDATSLGERRRQIRRHLHPHDLHRLILQSVSPHEILVGQNHSCRTVRCGTALQLGQRPEHLGRAHDLLQAVLVLKLRVRIVDGVQVILVGDFREMLGLGAVLLHVLYAGVTEHLGCYWTRVHSCRIRLSFDLLVRIKEMVTISDKIYIKFIHHISCCMITSE